MVKLGITSTVGVTVTEVVVMVMASGGVISAYKQPHYLADEKLVIQDALSCLLIKIVSTQEIAIT